LFEEESLSPQEIGEVVLATRNLVIASTLGSAGFHIGEDIFPKPQNVGFFLHELIPLELAARHPEEWRGEPFVDR
jgi:hypothetical protein